MSTQLFALALAKAVEGGDATEAHLMLRAQVNSICKRLRMLDDAGEVLQNTWIAILELAFKHTTAPRIAAQTKSIIYNNAVNIVRARERARKLDAIWEASQAVEASNVSEELNVEEELAILLARLRKEHRDQHDAVYLSLHCVNQEEARAKWQDVHEKQITPANFRQIYHRGTQRLRHYWEQEND